MKETTVNDLIVARDRVDRGWSQRGYGAWDSDEGDVCVLGAIAYAIGQNPCLHLIDGRALWAYLPTGFKGLVSFNDDPRTTKEDVLTLFDKALADLGGLG